MDIGKLAIRISSGMGKRKSRSQKKRFISYFADTLTVLGYKCDLYVGKQKKNPTINLVCGDVRNTSLVVSSFYNTDRVPILPGYVYYPLNDQKNSKTGMKDFIVRAVLGALIVAGLIVCNIYVKFMQDSLVARILVNLLFLGVFLLVMVGLSAPYNMNCNSSILAMMFKMADDRKELNKKPVLIFADAMNLITLGYKYVADYLKEKQMPAGVPFVLVTCLADGEELFAVRRQSASPRVNELVSAFKKEGYKEIVMSDEQVKNTVLEHFPDGLVLLSGSMEGEDIAVSKVRGFRDTDADIERLDRAVEILNSYVTRH